MRPIRWPMLGAVALLALSAGASAQTVIVQVISSPPDLVTLPDVLIRVQGANLRPQGWASNDTLITPFYQDKSGDWFGLIGHGDYLIPGQNFITVVPNAADPNRQLTFLITVHDADQPLFGTARAATACSAQGLGVSATTGENGCDRVRADFLYRGTDGAWSRVLASGNAVPATTTTSSGQTVPLIVRVDQGVIDGARYAIAFLDNPGQTGAEPWPAGPPPAAWNGTLVYLPDALGASGATRVGFFDLGSAGPGTAASCASALVAQGYAVASTALPVGAAAADAAAASALLRVRERFIKTYGLPTATVGLAPAADQQTALARIAKAYPGLDRVADGATASGPHCP